MALDSGKAISAHNKRVEVLNLPLAAVLFVIHVATSPRRTNKVDLNTHRTWWEQISSLYKDTSKCFKSGFVSFKATKCDILEKPSSIFLQRRALRYFYLF